MGSTVVVVAIVWLSVLIAAAVVRLIRARSLGSRILAVDLITLLLIAILGLIAAREGTAGYLDAALVLALLAFVATTAVARSYGGRGPFS
jgi:multicomponent Na+:H+ antiporter subunit F